MKVCLIDGSGYIFRAFYALPPMTAPDGTPVNAVYGFTNMYLRLTSKIGCDYSLTLFDAKRENYRNQIYPAYKANRIETPPELIPQFEIIREAVHTLNLHYLDMEGYEADDLIATYAKLALEQGFEVTIVSADKDLMQLIRPGIEFYDPMKDKFFGPEDVKEKFGVYPDKVIDVQALMGDSTDNVPGVPGIGPKTAAELVNEFGSLDEVLKRAGEIKQNKRRETLIDNADKARVSMELVRLKDDVPVDPDFSRFACRKPEMQMVQDFVAKYDFKSLRARIENWVRNQCRKTPDSGSSAEAAAPIKKEITKKYQLIQDESALKKLAEQITQKRRFAFDTETTGLNPVFDDIVGISIAIEEGEAFYIPLKHKAAGETDTKDLFAAPSAHIKQLPLASIAKILGPVFTSRSILKIGHNIKFDLHFMAKVLGKEAEIFPIEDTSIMSYDLDSSEHGQGMDELSDLFLDYKTLKYEDVCGSGKNKICFDQVGLEQALDYAAEDADITLRLYNALKPRILSEHKATIYDLIDKPLVYSLKEMEQNGILVDKRRLLELSKEFEGKLKNLEQEVYQIAGQEFNLGSPKQIGEILYTKLGLKGKKTASGNMQTGAGVLEKLAEEHDLPRKILDWRAFAKLKSTYTDSLLELLDKNNRIHTTYNQVVANTGRLASNNPNLQNIPIRSEEGRKIRSCFIAPPGHQLVSADYSQVELRLMAEVAEVKGLREAFAHGIDIHAATASRVFGIPKDEVTANQRRDAKAINFGIIYGISQYGLARQLDIPADQAKVYIDNYFQQMPEIKTYMETTIDFAKKHGYVLTPLGRKIAINGINDQNKRIASFAERAAINAPLQGGAADIIKLAMNAVFKTLKEDKFKSKMLLQVHDELVFECPDTEVERLSQMIKDKMENVVKYCVPLIVEVGAGHNWTEAH